MREFPLTISSLPRAILHIDADAFFASCEQSRNPKLKGKPVVTGKERGIAASMSYEAKARGVTRGMPLWQIKKVCPDAVLLPSGYGVCQALGLDRATLTDGQRLPLSCDGHAGCCPAVTAQLVQVGREEDVPIGRCHCAAAGSQVHPPAEPRLEEVATA